MAVTGPYDHSLKLIGLSTDTKPTTNVLVGTKFYETDTGSTYIYSGSTWVQEQENKIWQSMDLMSILSIGLD